MIPHEKIFAFRDLIWECDVCRIALASGCKVRLIKRSPIDNHVPGIIDIHLITRLRDYPLNQNLVVK